MDWTISKSIDGMTPRVVHTFTQAETGSKAKRAAQDKLDEMWRRVCGKPTQFPNSKGTQDEFSYDYHLTPQKTVRVRFFIAPLDKKRGNNAT